VSASRPLTVSAPERPASWRAALEAAVRIEFRATPLVPPPGSPLLPGACAVPGCVRTGFTAPWGRFQARLCHGHADRWIADGRPTDSTGWIAAQAPLLVMAPTVGCAVAACPRSAAKGGLCRAHDRRWHDRGKPPLDEFVRCAPLPRRVLAGVCRAPDCEFPAGGTVGLCDRHSDTFHAWRHHRVRVGDPDPSVEAYLENITSRADGTAHVWLELPDHELLELELRFVIQAMHDDGKGLIAQARWRELVRELNALAVQSLLDHDLDWWDAHRPAGCDRAPRWLCYLKRGWRALFAFRARAGLDDPWAHDLWYIDALPIDRAARHIRTLDWRPVNPGWLRELAKRWARHKLRNGISLVHVTAVRLATVRFGEFCEQHGWPLNSAGCLSRELFDAFLDHVRYLPTGVTHKHAIACGVKQLFEETHDLGWIELRTPRVYLPGEIPTRRDWLPRALPAAVVNRLNQPDALDGLGVRERAIVLVLMDGGLRASDTIRLALDPVMTGSDGAPYLRYWNHTRRREAVVPISDRAVDAIAAQASWAREHFPGCGWLFPRVNANGRGQQPAGYGLVYDTLRRWAKALDLRDEHGQSLSLQPHAFRHTYATGLVNNDVDLFSVQSLLDHDSPQMTWRYARLSKESLRRKWEQGQQRINIGGETVPLDVDGDLSDAAWAKEQIARAKQSLPNGWCGLPLQQTCPHPNACLTCPAFLTDATFLEQHREQLTRTEQLIAHGQANGNDRLVEINQPTKVNLIAIIQRAEQLGETRREDTDAAA
jgi:integrase